jgi:Ni,Fe-hydrogenase III small subunit/formate hydrogenlyase subunit 6/NADH:ubiquinone oxidoreductase subunit I
MPWILRGLRDGVVTTGYPRRPDGYGPTYRGAIDVAPEALGSGGSAPGEEPASVATLCPTGAIESVVGPDGVRVVSVDRGRCVLCGRCVEADSKRFSFTPTVEPAKLRRDALVVPAASEDDAALDQLRRQLHRRVKALRRSIHVRHVDAGSDGSEEWEVAALMNPVYDVQRLGIFFTASPRHADLLLATGVGTAGMAGPLRRTYDAMPGPKVVVAAGTDATSGGLVHPTYSAGAGIGSIVQVDVWVPGVPPSPFSLLYGILLGVGLLPRVRGAP